MCYHSESELMGQTTSANLVLDPQCNNANYLNEFQKLFSSKLLQPQDLENS